MNDNNITVIISVISSIMILFFLGTIMRSMVSPQKKPEYSDVSKKTIKELMESSTTVEDLVRSIQKVEGR